MPPLTLRLGNSATLPALLLLGSVWLGICACSGPKPVEPQPLESVEPPPNFEQLDLAVREQFQELWQELTARDENTSAALPSRAAGAEWGALGQWFDVYDYADSAARCYRNASRLAPEEPRWPYFLGNLAGQDGQLEEARSFYVTASRLAPDETAPKIRLGDLALRRQEFDTAWSFYRDVLDAEPNNPGALLGLGRWQLLRGEAAAAVEPLEHLLTLQPEASDAHYSLAQAYRELGAEEKARQHLAKVPEENLDQTGVTLDSTWERELRQVDQGARALTRRGVRAHRRGDSLQAAVLLGRAVAADPDGPEERINYALALVESGHLAAALDELEKALELASSNPEMSAKAHFELGRLLLRHGQMAAVSERAARHLEEALALDPSSIPAHLELARLLHFQGQLDQALGHYATARALDPSNADVCFWHAALLILLERHREAVDTLTEDLRRIADAPTLRWLLARVLSSTDQSEVRDLTRARQLVDSENQAPDVFFAETVAMVAAQDGRFEDAVTFERAVVAALEGRRPRNSAHIARRRLALYEEGEPCRNPWGLREALLTLPVAIP